MLNFKSVFSSPSNVNIKFILIDFLFCSVLVCRLQSLDHLSYANEIIEFLAENFATEPDYVYYLKRMLALCLMPPTVKSIMDCSSNMSILVRFYDVMGIIINSESSIKNAILVIF